MVRLVQLLGANCPVQILGDRIPTSGSGERAMNTPCLFQLGFPRQHWDSYPSGLDTLVLRQPDELLTHSPAKRPN